MTQHHDSTAHPSSGDTEQMQRSNLFDMGSGLGLVVGSIASVVSQNVAFAALPISLAVALQIANRRQLAAETLNQQTLAQGAISRLAQHVEGVQVQIASQFQQAHSHNEEQFSHHRQERKAESDKVAQSFAQVRDLILTLEGKHENLGSNFSAEQQKLAEMLGELRQVANCTQDLQSNPTATDALYRRGISHVNLGDRAEAIADFTAVLQRDLGHAGAYHQRGLLQAGVGNRKQAVEDLRLASKYYFEQGDLENYQVTRDLSKEHHDLRHGVEAPDLEALNPTPAAVEEDIAPGTIPILNQTELSIDSLFN